MISGGTGPVTSADLFEVFQLLSDKIDEKHKNLRETVEELYQRSTTRMDAHDREDRLVADRVIRIEQSRSDEYAESVRREARHLRDTDIRVTLFSMFVSIVVSVGVFLMGRIWR